MKIIEKKEYKNTQGHTVVMIETLRGYVLHNKTTGFLTCAFKGNDDSCFTADSIEAALSILTQGEDA